MYNLHSFPQFAPHFRKLFFATIQSSYGTSHQKMQKLQQQLECMSINAIVFKLLNKKIVRQDILIYPIQIFEKRCIFFIIFSKIFGKFPKIYLQGVMIFFQIVFPNFQCILEQKGLESAKKALKNINYFKLKITPIYKPFLGKTVPKI